MRRGIFLFIGLMLVAVISANAQNTGEQNTATCSMDAFVCIGSSYTYVDGTESHNIIIDESHTSCLVGQAANGYDSLVTENVKVHNLDQQPSVISGPNNICTNTSASYSVVESPGVTYYWDLPMGWAGYSNCTSIDIVTSNTSGTITLVPFTACGIGIARTLYVNVNVDVPEADFDFETDQAVVEFTNLTLNASGQHWDFGDGTSSVAESPSHEYTSSGEFLVRLTTFNSCGETTKEELVNMMGVSVSDIDDDEISVYPNPTNGLLNVEAENLTAVKIVNASGSVVKEISSMDWSGPIDLSPYAKGVYFVNLILEDEIRIKKVILE
jgi:PKD repeat protein